MKARKGWCIAYDEVLKKMIPYFIKVRSQDIVPTDPMVIEDKLKEISTRWQTQVMENMVDYTAYHLTANWNTTTDPNGEECGSEYTKGAITYYLYKSGRLHVEGAVRVKGEIAEDAPIGFTKYHKRVYLPFALPENNNIRFYFTCGQVANASLSGWIDTSAVTNQKINPDHADTEQYLCMLEIMQQTPADDTKGMELLMDCDNFQSSLKNIDDYIRSYVEIGFTYDGIIY